MINMSDLVRFIHEEEAMGTVEVVLIVAVLIGIGLLFKDAAVGFVKRHIDQMNGVNVNINEISPTETPNAGTTTGG